MPERKTDLVMRIDLWEETSSFDREVHGHLEVGVWQYRVATRADESPCTELYAYESIWAHFGAQAFYGYMKLSDGGAYGHEWGYKPDYTFIQAHELGRITKGLKTVEKKYEQYTEELGSRQSCGQWVVYLAKAVGVKRFAWKLKEPRYGVSWKVTESAEEARYHIDTTIRECQERQHKQDAAA